MSDTPEDSQENWQGLIWRVEDCDWLVWEDAYILNCPFCGAERRNLRIKGMKSRHESAEEDEQHASYCIICEGCSAQGPDAETAEDALTKWNARTIK